MSPVRLPPPPESIKRKTALFLWNAVGFWNDVGFRRPIFRRFSGNLFFSAIRDQNLTSTDYVISLESSWGAGA